MSNYISAITTKLKAMLGMRIAGPDTDPQRWLSTLYALPNPDPILRSMGRADVVYESMLRDPQVISDVRSIRGEFMGYSQRINAGNSGDPRSVAARDLCEAWMAGVRPSELCDWREVMWQMISATLTGYRAHEPVWDVYKGSASELRGYILPTQVIDVPNRRVRFNADGQGMLISTTALLGQVVEPHKLIITRHMPTCENPYGLALLSCIFWVWTFKTGGWRAFVKYCERHGLPWPVGRYPEGADDKTINGLAASLEAMLESAYAVVQDGNKVELLTPTSSGTNLPQERLIELANREISKTLTSQAMLTELFGTGSRAATETASKRQSSVNAGDVAISGHGMDQLFHWITFFNFGPEVAPPTLEHYRNTVAGKDRAETYEIARKSGARPSRGAMLKELGIPAAADDADALLPDSPAASPPPPRPPAPAPAPISFSRAQVPFFEYARGAGMTESEAIDLAAQAADDAIEQHMLAPVAQMLAEFERQGKTLDDVILALGDMVGGPMTDDALREVLSSAMQYAVARGVVDKAI